MEKMQLAPYEKNLAMAIDIVRQEGEIKKL